jgi:hypothetical protein
MKHPNDSAWVFTNALICQSVAIVTCQVYESPHHLLDQLAPPHTKFTLSNMDWRFVVNFLLEAEAPECARMDADNFHQSVH